MKKKNYSVMALVQKAIIDSMNFSKIGESQIFIDTSPHIDAVHFQAYQGGWDNSKKISLDISLYIRGYLSPNVKEAKKILKPIYDFIKQNSKLMRKEQK